MKPKTETEHYRGAICGDGMCPYVPCKDFPNCKHMDKIWASTDMVRT